MKAPSLWTISKNDKISQLILLFLHSPTIYCRLGSGLGVREQEENEGGNNQLCLMEEELVSMVFKVVLYDIKRALTGVGVGIEYQREKM